MEMCGRILIFVIISFVCHSGLCQTDPDCVCFQEVEAVRGFKSPPIIVNAGDGTDRLFVGEQTGQLWALHRNPNSPGGWDLQAEVFLNVSVHHSGVAGDEQGFLQVRFHPDYVNNGLFYSWYSMRDEGGEEQRYTRLAEHRVDPEDPNRADPEYLREVFRIKQVSFNHNGGDLLFLDDGTLLIFTGDGGTAGDPYNLALNKSVPLGKVLRIDVDNRDVGLEYAIPADNPFFDDPTALPELYAFGLRNPWRAFMDSLDGRIFIGDVGQSTYEEIDVLQAGGNFGWSAFEGNTCYKPEFCPEYVDVYIPPIHEYSLNLEGGDGQCIIQGPMYRGCENPGFENWLIFADYVAGDLYRLLDQGNSPVWEGVKDVMPCEPQVCEDAGFSSDYFTWILTYGEDERREVYFTALPDFLPPDAPEGRMYKMVDPANRGVPCELQNSR